MSRAWIPPRVRPCACASSASGRPPSNPDSSWQSSSSLHGLPALLDAALGPRVRRRFTASSARTALYSARMTSGDWYGLSTANSSPVRGSIPLARAETIVSALASSMTRSPDAQPAREHAVYEGVVLSPPRESGPFIEKFQQKIHASHFTQPSPSPHVRTFALFVVLLAGALLLAAALTYPAWLLVGTVSVEPVHRVMNRLAMLIALVGLIVLTRRLGLGNRTALGYGLPRAEFFRQLGIGWAAGIGLMLPLVALLLALDVRQIKPGLDGELPSLLLGGVVSGLAVAFIEETFFRGILFTAVARTSGARAAIIAPTVLYAALHFLGGKLRVPPEEVSWIHGFQVLSGLFERYSQPLAFVDSFLALRSARRVAGDGASAHRRDRSVHRAACCRCLRNLHPARYDGRQQPRAARLHRRPVRRGDRLGRLRLVRRDRGRV